MMDLNNIWDEFLNKIKDRISPMLYETWFQDTKLDSIEDNIVKVIVPMSVHKKHLKENYFDLIDEIFTDITGTNFQFEFITEDELEDKVKIISDITEGVPIYRYDSNINSKYTFDNFIVGSSNKFAKATALAVAEVPGLMYNPLFIYSRSALGKTHLMHAIGNYILKNSNKKVLYVTCEKFIEDFVGINVNKNANITNDFKKKYRDVDVLMIDDIQYLGNAIQTQQEFFNTFNALYDNNKQIIISSDRSPEDLKLLEDRLKTRFNWGLTIDILPPDFDLRFAIITKLIEGNNVVFPDDCKEYIASNCIGDIRKLEGAVTRVLAYSTMMSGVDIDLNITNEALKDFFTKSIISKNNIDKVQQVIANHYNISVDNLKSKKRNAEISEPRQIAMYICRNIFNEPLQKIGIEFGGKNHTTVMHSVNKIDNELKSNPEFNVEIQKIINMIK